MPLNMFVYPVREDAQMPEEFTKYGAGGRGPRDHRPRGRSPRTVTQWVKSWTSLVLK